MSFPYLGPANSPVFISFIYEYLNIQKSIKPRNVTHRTVLPVGKVTSSIVAHRTMASFLHAVSQSILLSFRAPIVIAVLFGEELHCTALADLELCRRGWT